MKRIITLLALAVGIVLFGASPALATETTTHTYTTAIADSPDDGCPPWARDTFTRTTTVTEVQGGFTIDIKDAGTFKLTNATHATGSLQGVGTFHVTGGMLIASPDVADFNNNAYACKENVAANRTTGNWWKRFVDGGESAGIVDWRWTYTRECNGEVVEQRVETPAGVTGGDITGEPVCVSASPSTSASASPSAKPSTSAAAAPTGTTRTSPAAALPVTGSGTTRLAILGGLLLVGGAAAVLIGRRRRAVE